MIIFKITLLIGINMRKRNFIAMIFMIVSTSCMMGGGESTDKPNILFIIVDDLGWTDVSTGSPNLGHGSNYYETPNVDKLASKGDVFYQCVYLWTQLCPHSCIIDERAIRYTHQNVYGFRSQSLQAGTKEDGSGRQQVYLDLEQVTLAEILKSAGYATAHFGKWHFGRSL